MKYVYKQYQECQDKMLDRVPRAQAMPISEIQRVYDFICEKNGDVEHDAATETF